MAFSSSPSTLTTVPRPKESWLTRSPDRSEIIGRLPGDRTPGRPAKVATAGVDEDLMPVVSVRCQSIRSAGISSRKRDAGLYCGEPHPERTIALELSLIH